MCKGSRCCYSMFPTITYKISEKMPTMILYEKNAKLKQLLLSDGPERIYIYIDESGCEEEQNKKTTSTSMVAILDLQQSGRGLQCIFKLKPKLLSYINIVCVYKHIKPL